MITIVGLLTSPMIYIYLIYPHLYPKESNIETYTKQHTPKLFIEKTTLLSLLFTKILPHGKKTAVVTSDYHSPHRAFARRAATAPVLFFIPFYPI